MTATATTQISPTEVAAWREYVGRVQTRREVLSAETLRRFAVAVGSSSDVQNVPPPLGHWAFFADAPAADALEEDGHPQRGGFMPPVRLPRRMFAAASFRFVAALTLEAEAELRLTIADVRHRSGSAGDLVFVDVERSLAQAGLDRVIERQTIVYRGAGEPAAAIEPAAALPGTGIVWAPGPVDLFRFSAVTFNAHRIHYDAAYAQREEGYPGLVVHGPFTAAKLCALAARGHPGMRMRSFEFRANAPLFAGQPIRLQPGTEPGTVEAIRCDGVTAMRALAGFSDQAAP